MVLGRVELILSFARNWISVVDVPESSGDRYLRFPPHLSHVLVPQAPASAAALGMTLYTASRPMPLILQNGLWLVARAGATRWVPGRRESWRPPMDDAVFAELVAQWCSTAGIASAPLSFYLRPQSFRPGLVCLLCAGRRSLLIRVRRDVAELDQEKRISSVAARRRDLAFRVPRLLGTGEVDGWHWAGYEVMARRPHRPARRCSQQLAENISSLVSEALARPDGVPTGWQASHGDLTPWNLRLVRGKQWLIDWEDARWAPPQADLVYFHAASAAIGVRRSSATLSALRGCGEAREYWATELRGRRITAKETELVEGMLNALAAGPD